MITFHTLSNDVVVHQHTAEENAVNVYLIETLKQVVATDATSLLLDARDLRATLDEIGKPFAGVFITHPQDHVNGISVLRGSSEAPVFATESVDTTFREIEPRDRELWQPRYGNEYPAEITFSTDPVAANGRVSLGGVSSGRVRVPLRAGRREFRTYPSPVR